MVLRLCGPFAELWKEIQTPFLRKERGEVDAGEMTKKVQPLDVSMRSVLMTSDVPRLVGTRKLSTHNRCALPSSR